ncbi:hypothetical protein FWF48_02910 [Candidatus Saccharibacteria bacterium]|nr:hypothetical protein [Candidatus Saccharibacteria bacterium]
MAKVSKKPVKNVKKGKTVVKKATVWQKLSKKVVQHWRNLQTRRRNYLKRRPHRSFRLSHRIDYQRSLDMPGFWSFTSYVFSTLKKYKKPLLRLLIFMVVMMLVLIGLMSQSMYDSLGSALESTNKSMVGGQFGAIGKAGLLLLSTVTTGGLNQSPTEGQQIISVLIFILVWLTTIWILRNSLAGNKIKMRDGLYQACSPLISTVLVALVLFIQLIPALIAVIAYSAAVTTGFLDTPFYAIIFWIAAVGLGVLSLYLITSTVIALVAVTIPGMYPLTAIKISGDLVIGRRIRILLRVLWLAFILALLWAVIMIPIILLDGFLKAHIGFIENWPIVPFALLIMSAASMVFASSYVYLFYRKLVDDGSSPA